MKRWLFLWHRWLGFGASLLVLLWFASGFVMMYVPYPELTESERLVHAARVVASQVTVPPALALAVAPGTGGGVPERLRVNQGPAGPVYGIFRSRDGWVGVDARQGTLIRIDAASAAAAAASFVPDSSVARAELIDDDQWSMGSALDAHRPLWAVAMTNGMRLYVSSRTGEVVRDASAKERAWNWVGSVLHWVYPAALRRNASAWHWVVVVLASYALATAVLGTWIGILRWRRYANGAMSPYRGWMRWHHVLGLGGSALVIGWLLSGLLSMNPGQVFSRQGVSADDQAAWRGSTLQASVQGLAAGQPPVAERDSADPTVEIEWLASPDGAVRVTRSASGVPGPARLRDGTPLSVDEAFVQRRLARLTDAPVLGIDKLDGEDLYFYGRREARALPVWRVRLGDRARTWLYVDGTTGELRSRVDASGRAERWLYHGLHSWDVPALLAHRALRDVLMVLGLCLGTAFSITSVVVGWQRLDLFGKRARHPTGFRSASTRAYRSP